MRCSFCGYDNPDNAKYCENCMTFFSDENMNYNDYNERVFERYSDNNNINSGYDDIYRNSKKNSSLPVIIGIAIILGIAATVITLLLFAGNNDKDNDIDQTFNIPSANNIESRFDIYNTDNPLFEFLEKPAEETNYGVKAEHITVKYTISETETGAVTYQQPEGYTEDCDNSDFISKHYTLADDTDYVTLTVQVPYGNAEDSFNSQLEYYQDYQKKYTDKYNKILIETAETDTKIGKMLTVAVIRKNKVEYYSYISIGDTTIISMNSISEKAEYDEEAFRVMERIANNMKIKD